MWDQRPDGALATRMLTEPTAEQRAAIDLRVSEVAEMIGDTRFTVRFPSPVSTGLRG